MAYRSKTLRKLPETSRNLARLINELNSVVTRIRHLLPEIERLEHDNIALYHISQVIKNSSEPKAHKSKLPATPPTEPPIDQSTQELESGLNQENLTLAKKPKTKRKHKTKTATVQENEHNAGSTT